MMKIYNTVLIILLIILACVFGALEGYKYKLEQKTEQYIEECENGMDLSIKLQTYAREYSQLMKGMDEVIRDFETIGRELDDIESQLEEYKARSAQYFSNNYILFEYELIMLYRIVEAEATGGESDAKINVAHVIFNRVNSDQFPDTIERVIFQKNQFSPISDGRYGTVKITESTISAVNAALNGIDTTNGSTFFMYRADSGKNNVTWFDNNLEFVMKDSIGHEYFR